MMRRINPRLPQWQSRVFAADVLRDAQRVHLDPRLIMAIVTVESHWNAHAVSHVGAYGLGQLMPGTAAQLHVNSASAGGNLLGTSTYLGRLVTRFSKTHDTYRNAIAGYNAGPMAVSRYGGVPPYAETQHYVRKVLRVWQQLRLRLNGPITLASSGSPHRALRIVPYWSSESASAVDAIAQGAKDASNAVPSQEPAAAPAADAPAAVVQPQPGS